MGAVLARPVCQIVGLLYPAYRTFKVLKDVEEPLEALPIELIGPASAPNNVDQQLQLRQQRNLVRRQQQEQWLTYWLVMALFSVSEWWSDHILSIFPFYYPAKIVFLVWLQLPQTNGARWIYKKYLEPLLLKHERSIDRSIQDAGVRAQQLSDRAFRFTLEQVQQNLRQQFAQFLEHQRSSGVSAAGSQQQQWEAFLRQHIEQHNNVGGNAVPQQMYPNLFEMQQQQQQQQ